MNRPRSLYEACHDLFAGYPLAVDHCSGAIRSMILTLQVSGDAKFFVLSQDCSEGEPFYLVRPWRARGIVGIEADGGKAAPDAVVNVLTSGVPVPRHGSLFGWRHGNDVIALIAVYTEYTPEYPEPSWAMMPRAGIPEEQWPPFAGEHLLGHWFWQNYRGGSIVSLCHLIAGTQDAVFWADTEAILGWSCCAVASDIRSREGYTLHRGCYVYYQALRAGKPVPPLDSLLTGTRKVDLAPRYRLSRVCHR